MPIRVPACLTAVALMAPGAAHAAPEPQTLTVTNTTDRVAFCTLIFDGRARTELAIRPGRSWYEPFDPRRDLRLVCQRAKRNYFGPLEAGRTYRLVAAENRNIDMAEGSGE